MASRIIDIHPHIISKDEKKYPITPIGGKRSVWSSERPIDFEKLVSSRSIEQVMEIQTSFAKRAYDEYMHQLTKIGGMYAELAKEAYRPVERAMQNGR